MVSKRSETNGQGATVGLVLPGGGARGAYQAGVIKGIAEILPEGHGHPFPVVSGTSAGAINATVLAANARRFHAGVRDLVEVWSQFRCELVYRCDWPYVIRQGLHWLAALSLGGLGPRNPHFLLDNAPLRELLDRHVDFVEIDKAIDAGALRALGVTASGFASARAVSFFAADHAVRGWERARRTGRRTALTLDHLMASVAVPFVFPPVLVGEEYFGDGALREATPLSPALHLGADRLLVIGVRDEKQDTATRDSAAGPPSFGEIAGYMLDTVFLDGLYADLERLTRVNRLLAETDHDVFDPTEHRQLRPVDVYIVVPSEDIRAIARRHGDEFPAAVRLLLRGSGSQGPGARQLMSYLLFEAPYCRELIELGYRDCLAQRDRLVDFLEGRPGPQLQAPPHLMHALIGP